MNFCLIILHFEEKCVILKKVEIVPDRRISMDKEYINTSTGDNSDASDGFRTSHRHTDEQVWDSEQSRFENRDLYPSENAAQYPQMDQGAYDPMDQSEYAPTNQEEYPPMDQEQYQSVNPEAYQQGNAGQYPHGNPEMYQPNGMWQNGQMMPNMNYAPNQKRKQKTALIIGIAAAVAVVLGVLAFFMFKPNGIISGIQKSALRPEITAVEETVTDFADAYNDGNFEKLTEFLDSDIREKINNIKLYGSIITQAAGVDADIDSLLNQALGYAAFGASFEITEMDTTIDGDTAKVKAKINISSSIPGINGDKEKEQNFSLVKEDGKWYISGLK